jgi:uncharacterized peroxidase-related enzyme
MRFVTTIMDLFLIMPPVDTNGGMASIATTSPDWGACLLPPGAVPPAMAAEVKHELGAVPGWLPRLACLPWVVRAFAKTAAKPFAYAPPGLSELIGLVVSQDNSCRYCFGVQRVLMRVFGYSEAYLAKLERDFHIADLSPMQRAALDYARKISRANPRPRRGEYEELERAGLSRPAIAEVAFAAAAGAFMNRVATLLALPVEAELESLPKSPLFRAMRPMMAWRMRPKPRRPEPVARNEGPGAALVAALGDSPSAGLLRRMLDDAWDSPVLPRRTKALMFAVIAKALECMRCEEEARGELVAAGLDAATIDGVLANLGSPALDAREALLVPFGRETVRYQTQSIQRRVREVTAGMSPAETIEVVAVAALANAICRLSVLLDAC